MYELASGIYQSYFAPPKLNILIVGIDFAGKTALLEQIKFTTIITKLDNIDDVDNSSNAGAAVAGVGIDIEHDGLLTKRHPACSNNASSSCCPICQKDTNGVLNHPRKLEAKKRRLVGRDGTWEEYYEVGRKGRGGGGR